MHDPELETTIALAKSATATTKPKSFWYGELRKHANRRRQPGETVEKAFAKFITDPDGIPLYAAYKAARGPSVAFGTEQDGGGAEVSEGLAGLRTIAAKLQASDPSLTGSAAMARAVKTPEGARLYMEDRRARVG